MHTVGGVEESRKVNKRDQYTALRENTQYIMLNFDAIFWERKGLLNIKAEFISRFTTAQQAKKHHKFALLQKDLWALILLIENGFDTARYRWDTTDMYNVAQDFIRQTGACTDIEAQFPQMVQDVIISMETNWQEPPVDEMQKAQEYFAEKAAQSMQSTLI